MPSYKILPEGAQNFIGGWSLAYLEVGDIFQSDFVRSIYF